MSRIDDLINELCPDGVEFDTLASLCQIFSGCAFASELFNTAGVGLPLIRIRDINTGFSGTYYSGEFEDRYVVRDGDFLIGMDGDFKASLWRNGDALLNQRVCRLQDFSPLIVPQFLFHYMQDELDAIHELTQQSTVKHLSTRVLGMSRVPVPPLEVQFAIARILDTFTQLEAELEAELEARRQQYQYYRDSLLTFTERERVRWTTLSDVCTKVSSGSTPLATRPDFYGGKIPWLRTQEVQFRDIYDTELHITDAGFENSATRWIPENCVIVAISGATRGRLAINKIPLTTNQHCCNLEIDANQANYRFVFHWLASQHYELRALGQGAREDLNIGMIKRFLLPLPSLDEQVRIVGILDKFDALVNDLSIGLPAELAARRQQYEYYRDRLLSFDEAA